MLCIIGPAQYTKSTNRHNSTAVVLIVNGVIKGIFASEIVHYMFCITGPTQYTNSTGITAQQCVLIVNGVIKGIYASEIVHYMLCITGPTQYTKSTNRHNSTAVCPHCQWCNQGHFCLRDCSLYLMHHRTSAYIRKHSTEYHFPITKH
jgi:hypothetical protein